MSEKPFYIKLKYRALIRVSGPDAAAFLQNLITNDVKKLETQPAIYACLLTPQGKFLHDFFVIKEADGFLLDCEGGDRAQDLLKRLMMYRLRANVTLDCKPENAVHAVFYLQTGWPDPRHSGLGWRSFEKPEAPEEKPFEDWDRLRISLCVPDGSRDLIVGQSTMDEARMDQLSAIDYDKGCYVGQELTARMHYRGLGKKHLYAIKSETGFPDFGEPIRDNQEKILGEMRSSCKNMGISLLKDAEIDHLDNTSYALI